MPITATVRVKLTKPLVTVSSIIDTFRFEDQDD